MTARTKTVEYVVEGQNVRLKGDWAQFFTSDNPGPAWTQFESLSEGPTAWAFRVAEVTTTTTQKRKVLKRPPVSANNT